MAIILSGDATVPQPVDLLEELIQIQSENTSISGSLQRSKINQKKQVTMQYDMLSPADYQNLISKFTTGSGLYYSNNQSNYSGGIFAFSGLPYFSESSYVPGASLYRPFQVKIREL